MLADIAQDLEEPKATQPVGVVHHLDAALAFAEKTLEDRPLPREIRLDLILGLQRTLVALAAGVPDEAGAAAKQGDGPVSRRSEPPQEHDGEQIADGQAVRGRVEPAIAGADARGEMRREFGRGDLMQQAAPLQFVEEVQRAGSGSTE